MPNEPPISAAAPSEPAADDRTDETRSRRSMTGLYAGALAFEVVVILALWALANVFV